MKVLHRFINSLKRYPALEEKVITYDRNRQYKKDSGIPGL